MRDFPGLRVTIMVFAAWASAPAQSPIDPEHIPAARSAFESANRGAHLRCGFEPVKPALTYGLQFQTGYAIDIPLQEFAGRGRNLDILLRVTPEGRDPVYLGVSGLAPNIPADKAVAPT